MQIKGIAESLLLRLHPVHPRLDVADRARELIVDPRVKTHGHHFLDVLGINVRVVRIILIGAKRRLDQKARRSFRRWQRRRVVDGDRCAVNRADRVARARRHRDDHGFRPLDARVIHRRDLDPCLTRAERHGDLIATDRCVIAASRCRAGDLHIHRHWLHPATATDGDHAFVRPVLPHITIDEAHCDRARRRPLRIEILQVRRRRVRAVIAEALRLRIAR